MARVVFMGTPDFSVPALRALIETQKVVGVVTQPDRPAGRGQQPRPAPVKQAATAAGIPIYQPASLRSEEAAEPIRQWAPEIIVVAAFGQILRQHVLNLPPHGCLNVHASLLPRWRGASPIQYAILAGDEETGISLMQMEVGLDKGPIYVQQTIRLRADETAASLHDRLAELGGLMLRRYLASILAGELPAYPQNEAEHTYAPQIKKSDGQLDWQKPVVYLERHIRAMFPWPGAFTGWNGAILKVLSARVFRGALPVGGPGQVVAVDDGNPVVLTEEGGLELLQLQLAGRRAMTATEFVRGQPHFIGSRLSTVEV